MSLLARPVHDRGDGRSVEPRGAMTIDIPEPVTPEVEDLRWFLGECTAGILGAIPQLPKPEARLEAAQLMAIYARNRKYTWASLRAALSRHPTLASQLPDTPGPVVPRARCTCARTAPWCGRECSSGRRS